MNDTSRNSTAEAAQASVQTPLVSVVTVCFNEKGCIDQCVQSVLEQSYENIEYVVIDGASTDGTKEFLDSVRGVLSYYVSEPDGGIYAAMNKALRMASGEIIYFLNANDYFYDNHTIKTAVKIFIENPDLKIISGRVRYTNCPVYDGIPFSREDFSYIDKLALYARPIPQQCLFVKKDLFDRFPWFNESYKICGDYDWLVRMINNGVHLLQVQDIFCLMDFTGISVSETSLRRREKNLIILRNSSFKELLTYGYRWIFGQPKA